MLAVAGVLLRDRLAEPGGAAFFGGLAATGLALLIPGVLLAPRRPAAGRLRRGMARLSDFWLVAVPGLLVLHLHLLAVTGRPTWFYAWLLVDRTAHAWAGPEGLTPNLGLFLPVAASMGLAMVAVRLAVGRLRGRRLPGRVYALLLAGGAAVALHPAGWASAPGGSPGGWERALPEVTGPTGEATRDTVLIVLESLRADVLEPRTMPRASALAEGGLVLGRHHAGANSSLLGLHGLLTGRPAAHAEADLAAGVMPPLLAAARRAGYRTAWFDGGHEAAGAGGFGRLAGPAFFDRHHAGANDDWAAGDAWALDRLADTLAEPNRPPVFAVVFLVATHFNYPPPPADERRFAPAAGDGGLLVPRPPTGPFRTPVVNRYRNAVHAADARLGRFLDRIDLDATRIALTGDHGQSLYDDGTIGHWSRLSDAQTRVPFFLTGPGVPAGRIDATTAHADAAALLLRVLVGAPIDLAPPERPTLLVQSNPVRGTEDWVVLEGGRRTAWLRRGDAFRLLGPIDTLGRLRPTPPPGDTRVTRSG